MTAFLYLILLAALIALAPPLITRALAGKPYLGTERHMAWLAEMAALPETTAFDARPPLERTRLASVPVQRAELTDLPPADDAWLLPLLAEHPFVPGQRTPGSAS